MISVNTKNQDKTYKDAQIHSLIRQYEITGMPFSDLISYLDQIYGVDSKRVSPVKKLTPVDKFWCLYAEDGSVWTYGKRVSFVESITPGTFTLLDSKYNPIAIWNTCSIRNLELLHNEDTMEGGAFDGTK